MLVVGRVADGRVGSPAGLDCARFGATVPDSDAGGGSGPSLLAAVGDGDCVGPTDGVGESVADTDDDCGAGEVGSWSRYLSSE